MAPSVMSTNIIFTGIGFDDVGIMIHLIVLRKELHFINIINVTLYEVTFKGEKFLQHLRGLLWQ